MTQTPAHDWLRPRIVALLAEAAAAGITRDVAIAVLDDLLSSADFIAPSPGCGATESADPT